MISVLSGCWPALESWASLYLFSFHTVISVILQIITGVMADSMIADVVEDIHNGGAQSGFSRDRLRTQVHMKPMLICKAILILRATPSAASIVVSQICP